MPLPKIPPASPDLAADKLEALRHLIPEAFGLDRTVNFDKLKEALGGDLKEEKDRFGLNWPGKQEAMRFAAKPTTATLRPMEKKHSVDFDTTGNAIIEGDNLEVLKVLQRAYHGKIKMIYIDPPYNTGKDFVYPDNYAQPLEEYKKFADQEDEEGRLLAWDAFKEKILNSGRKHSSWLSMMAPRLLLARNLLKDDGAIFVSCDENEQANLRLLMNEIFGEENFIADLVWAAGRKNDSRYISISHEYLVCYAKNESALRGKDIEWRQKKKGLDAIYAQYERLKRQHSDNFKSITAGLKAFYRGLPDGDPSKDHAHYSHADGRGVYFPADISWPGGGGPKYEVKHPKTGKAVKVPSRGWMFGSPERMKDILAKDLVHFGEDEDSVPCIKSYLKDREFSAPYSVFYQDGRAATKRLRELLSGDLFDFPKDEEIIQDIASWLTHDDKQAIILDFFAGSGTTAHAVMNLNAQDGGKRKFILVQLPEPTPTDSPARTAGFQTIADITRERVKRAGTKVKEAAGLQAQNLDNGFRAFRLDSSNFKAWNPDRADPDTLLSRLEEFVSTAVPGRTPDDLLWEIILKWGLAPTVPLERFTCAGATYMGLGGRSRLVCMEKIITLAKLERLLEEIRPFHLCVLDAAFSDDTARAGAAAHFAHTPRNPDEDANDKNNRCTLEVA